ncbi:GNAT family N-acetyltransferase [Streptomyces sp. NPDC057702]|uniref:GNAT family N-acetyltransferase n=1 Tax=unclassified Streptomyces TaxID=2593676 RepID=UPI0036C4CE83
MPWTLPMPEQSGTHRGGRGPGEPAPPGHRTVVVEGSRFRLRELLPTDVDAVLTVFADPATTRPFGMRPFQPRDAVAVVEHAVTSARQHPRTHYRLGVSRARTDELIGTAKLVLDRPATEALVRTGHRSAEVGLALRADQATIGHSLEISYLLGVLGFDRLGLHRLWAGVLPANATAQRAAEKAGMTREGVLRHYGFANGVWHDIVQYAILEHDWRVRLGR